MTTFIATRAEPEFPVFEASGSGIVCRAFGTIQVAIDPVAADIYQMCRVPKGSVVIGGWFRLADMDTGVETLDMDVGWADNGVESADSDGFGNFGTLTGATITGYKPELGTIMPFGGVLISAGTQTFSNETIIQVTAVTAAATFAAGQMTVLVDYINP